eukprot:scaffold2661_cov44-Tisochrysis_lutea.AAC.1
MSSCRIGKRACGNRVMSGTLGSASPGTGQNSGRSEGHAYVRRPSGQIEAAAPHAPAASTDEVPMCPIDGRAPTAGGRESSRRRKKSRASGSPYVFGSRRSG